MGDLNNKATEFKREQLRGVLNQCTPEQIAFFNRMYKSIDLIPEEKMDRAYEQCIATIEKNRKKADGN
jgi:hypothetical protein